MYRFIFLFPVAAAILTPAAAQPTAPASFGATAATGRPSSPVEPAGPLTLQAALALALSVNAEISVARRELEAVDAAVMQAGALPNPSVGFEVQDTRRETRETTFQLSQSFELGGKRWARVRAAERGRDAAAAELKLKQGDVRATVITGFFNVLTAQERLRLAQDSAELAQRATTVASRRVAAGKVSPVEETRARVAETGVRLELVQARRELANARRQLSATWGNLLSRFERAEGELATLPESPELAVLFERLSASPALARARVEVERRETLTQVARSRRIPDLTMSLGVKRNQELGRNQAIVGFSIPLPVFDQNRGNVLESLRRADKAREELASTETRLGGELAEAIERLSTFRQEVDALQKEVMPGAQSASEAATKGYEFGKFGFLDVLDAQRTLLQVKSQYLRSLSEAHRAAADIDRILGGPLDATK
jgi:cobalt-zinc-cadmium efflux system outer membrane protein